MGILSEHVPEFEVRAFGSRVLGTAYASSDLDIAIMTEKPLPPMKIVELKEAFTESELPFKVDVLDWAATMPEFRKIIERQSVTIRSAGR